MANRELCGLITGLPKHLLLFPKKVIMIKYRGELPIRMVRNITKCIIGYRTAIDVAIKNATDGLIALVTLFDME